MIALSVLKRKLNEPIGTMSTSVDGSLAPLGASVRVENELVEDGGQTSADDRTQPVDLLRNTHECVQLLVARIRIVNERKRPANSIAQGLQVNSVF